MRNYPFDAQRFDRPKGRASDECVLVSGHGRPTRDPEAQRPDLRHAAEAVVVDN